MSDFSVFAGSGLTFGGEFAWFPTQETIENSHLYRFMQKHEVATLAELQAKSVGDIRWYWEAVLDYLDIQFYEAYIDILDLSRGKAWPHWCVGGKMNIIHNCLDKWMGASQENAVALRWEGEEGDVRVLTYADLYREVNRTANALRSLGLGKGDAIGLYMPMTPEIAIALLAIVKIGGIVLPLFSGYGVGAVATRLKDADAKALFCADGAYRRGRIVDMKTIVDEALVQTPTVEHVVVSRRTGNEVTWMAERDHWWSELIPQQDSSAPTERTDAEDILMIIYTSGTTGRPKGTVHTHCGFPVKAVHDIAMCIDVHAEDTLYWMSDMGWMMGPYEVFATLLLGSTMVFYDGAPDFPDVDRLWKLVEDHGVTHLGLSPTLIRALMPYGDAPVKCHDLSRLKAFASTGEPWNPDPWMWLFETVGEGRRPILNFTGGTEIGGVILSGNMLTPVKPTAFSDVVPGMDADVFDDDAKPLRGAVGELIVRQPWMGMTQGFWKDADRYIETYWSRFPDVWVHGDVTAIDADGQWYILGRSDDTIKVAGKRLGPAEVESILVGHEAVVEAGAIGVPHAIKGAVLICFVVLTTDVQPSDELKTELLALVTTEMGKALKPQDILFVPDLPKTRNAKVMRRVLRAAYLGEPAGDLSALVNPEIVEDIRDLGRVPSGEPSYRNR